MLPIKRIMWPPHMASLSIIVVNYMVGFPWEQCPEEALAKVDDGPSILMERGLHGDRARTPMARFPEVYGICSIRQWPWASGLQYW